VARAVRLTWAAASNTLESDAFNPAEAGLTGRRPTDYIRNESLSSDAFGWLSAVPLHRREFFGDDDRQLKELQAESYPFLVGALYDSARRRLLEMVASGRVDPELARATRERAELDRPALLSVYRRIAAHFRFACHAGPQLPLQFEDESYDIMIRERWEDFFRQEARELAEDDAVVRTVLQAVEFGDSAQARTCEVRIVDRLGERYGRFSLEHRMELLGMEPGADEIDGWRVTDEPE
jgi:predicted DCC family thiol-disulfide oxidoreductase YuxK